MPSQTVSLLIRQATRDIKRSKAIDHWQDGREQDDAEVLLAHVLGIDPDDLDFTATVIAADARRFAPLVKRRVTGEPVALITGEFDFRGMRLATRRGVFIPRYSSDALVDQAKIYLRRRRGERIAVDVCTGAGGVPIALANELRGITAYGLDISEAAVQLGKDNAKDVGIKGVRFIASDLIDRLPRSLLGKVAVFTMHPPYVTREEVATLPREIIDWEPEHTLTDKSEDGLELTRRLAAEAPPWLAPRGVVLIEIGPHLARKAAGVFRKAGYRDVSIERDDVGATRVIVAR